MKFSLLLRGTASVLCAVVALGMAGCGNGSGRTVMPSMPQSGQNRPDSYSSQQIFEGLLYGEGAAAALFPEWWGPQARQREGVPVTLTPQQHAGLVKNMHAFESEISQIDPAFFANFKTEITSGDPVRVSAVLARMRDDAQTIAAAHKVDLKSVAAKVRPDISTQVYKNAYVYDNVAALNQAVYAQVVVAQQYGAVWVALAAIAVVAAVVVLPLDAPNGTDFSKDAGVVLITQRLANR